MIYSSKIDWGVPPKKEVVFLKNDFVSETLFGFDRPYYHETFLTKKNSYENVRFGLLIFYTNNNFMVKGPHTNNLRYFLICTNY